MEKCDEFLLWQNNLLLTLTSTAEKNLPLDPFAFPQPRGRVGIYFSILSVQYYDCRSRVVCKIVATLNMQTFQIWPINKVAIKCSFCKWNDRLFHLLLMGIFDFCLSPDQTLIFTFGHSLFDKTMHSEYLCKYIFEKNIPGKYHPKENTGLHV